MLPRWLDRVQRGGLLSTAALFSMGYASLGLAALLLAVGIETGVRRRLPWQRGAVDIPILAFLGVFLISGWLSPYRPIATGSIGLAALTIYLGYGVTHRVLRRDPGFLRPLLWAWVAGATLAAAWAIVLHRLTDTPAFTPALGKNAVGTTLSIALIMALGLYAETASRWRHVMLVAGPVLAVGVLVTYARGAWLGTLVGVGTFFALTELRQTWRALVFVGALGVLTLLAAGSERAGLAERALTIPSLEANTPRVYLVRASLNMIADHPALGTGLNTFATLYPRYRLPGDPNLPAVPFAHNIFLNMTVEGGVAGLVAFAAVILAAAVTGWQSYARSRGVREVVLSATVLAAFVGSMAHQQVDGTFLSVHLGAGLWMLIAALIAGAPRS